jgi:hypothetical protein
MGAQRSMHVAIIEPILLPEDMSPPFGLARMLDA